MLGFGLRIFGLVYGQRWCTRVEDGVLADSVASPWLLLNERKKERKKFGAFFLVCSTGD